MDVDQRDAGLTPKSKIRFNIKCLLDLRRWIARRRCFFQSAVPVLLPRITTRNIPMLARHRRAQSARPTGDNGNRHGAC